jgi:hypothetical protein
MGVLENVPLPPRPGDAMESQTGISYLHAVKFKYPQETQETPAFEDQGISIPARASEQYLVNGFYV